MRRLNNDTIINRLALLYPFNNDINKTKSLLIGVLSTMDSHENAIKMIKTLKLFISIYNYDVFSKYLTLAIKNSIQIIYKLEITPIFSEKLKDIHIFIYTFEW